MVVEDPCEDLGSGGSTLNALLIAVEHLCASREFTVLSEDVLTENKILIINCGREYPLNRCGSAFLCLGDDTVTNTGYQVPHTIFTHQIGELNRLACKFGNGVWVTGGDAFWQFEELDIPCDYTEKTESLLVFTFKATSSHAKTSGVYRIDDEGRVTGIDYCSDKYNGTDSVPLVMTLLYMPVRIASTFLSLYAVHPLSSCTYYGIDNGSPGLQLSIFFDFILAATFGMEKDVFIESNVRGINFGHDFRLVKAREALYDAFSQFSVYAVFLDVKKYHYFQPPSIENLTQFWSLWFEMNPKALSEVTGCFFIPGLEAPSHSTESLDKCFRYNRMEILERWFDTIGNVIKNNVSRSVESFLKSICLVPGSGSSPAFALIRYLHKLCLEDEAGEYADRALFCIADVLALLARKRGGLRSGPAGNIAFAESIRYIQKGDIELGVIGMRNELLNWMDTPQKLIRAARHYEAAGQVFIQRNVKKFCSKHLPCLRNGYGLNCGVTVTTACRVDIAGGWTDTPPITMQLHRSAVLNIAIKVDGKHPVGCEVWPSYSQCGVFVKGFNLHLDTVDEIMNLSSKPSLPGSLIAAVLLAAQLVREDDSCLGASFKRAFSNGITGLEISTFSLLPHGSGLGTSSILAAALIAALWTLMGIDFDNDNICHAVLLAEQYLTTGGGWQDQVGGIIPGVKISRFSKEEKKIIIESIPCSNSFLSQMNKRLVLIYTGQTRLAKNLLQQVIRSWYAKDSHLTSVLESLVSAAENSSKQILEEVFPVKEVEKYYDAKKLITPTCEPTFVHQLIADLRTSGYIECAWLAGAGGGGFLNVWLSEGITLDNIKTYLSEYETYRGLSVHSVEVDMAPITISLH